MQVIGPATPASPAFAPASPPRVGAVVGAFLRARLPTASFAKKCAAVAALGALAGHMSASAALQARETVGLAMNFEPLLVTAVYLATLVEVVGALGGEGSGGWLTPLFTRGLARAALPAAVVLTAVATYGLLWTAGAAAYRLGGGAAGVWNPAPALARLPTVWAGLLAVAVYAAAFAALTRTRAGALALAVGFPATVTLAAAGYMFAHPDAQLPPLWARLPLLALPPLTARPELHFALRYSLYAGVLGTTLALLAHRWVGRTA